MSKVPNYFHFVFGLKKQTSPFHLMHYLCLKSCIAVNRPDTVYFYYDHEPYGYYWELIKPFLTLERINIETLNSDISYKDETLCKYKYAHIADFVRLEKLVERGGVYADIDTIFVRPMPQHFFGKEFILGREPDIVNERGEIKTSLCNAWISSSKGSDFGRLWLSKMPEHFNGSWSNHSTVLPAELGVDFPELIHIEPQSSFYDFIWSKEGIADLFERNVNVGKNVYSIHLWAHLWWDRSRKDFSRFHQGRLNHAYVNRASTTYAALAKPFLPEKKFQLLPERFLALKEMAKRLTRIS
ncbi:MAG: glycosyl transferase [Desulfobacteraceae bacterium]|nr:glycosyl transferase [Desulfobacteraceae bacterium]MBC2757863.1 glycosyl transferase [Desulfobacteraceae bacterium]